MMKKLLSAIVLAASIASASAQVGQIGSGQILGNSTASNAPAATPSTITAILDRALGTARGSIIFRNNTAWVTLAPGTVGLSLLSGGAGADVAYGILGLSGGGCAAALTASNGGILYSTASACSILAGTATAGQMLRSGSSAAPAWSTATWPATTTVSQILYSSSANVVAGLATGNGGVLNTSSGGVPSITATPTFGVASTATGQLILANSGSAFLTTIQAGAAAAARTWSWPTNFGSAGCVLSDAAGTGVLSCASFAAGGTVTQINAGPGISTALGTCASGNITASGTVSVCFDVNPQTGTTYTVLNSDQGKLVTHTNASSIAVTLPQAGAASSFLRGWNMWVQNRGAGTVTITPTTSTIDGAASLALATNQGVAIFSDGTNYFTSRGVGVNAVGTGLTLTGATAAIDKATSGNLEAGTSNKVLTADNIFDGEVTVTFAASQTLDFNTFLNARITATANTTSLTCSNIKASQSGTITWVQDGTGSRTMVAGWCSQFRWAGGSRGVLSTAASAIDALFYQCISTTVCYVSLAKAQAN